MKIDYRLARRLDTRPEKFTRPATLGQTLTAARRRAREAGPLIQIKPHGRDEWSPQIEIAEGIERLEERFLDGRDNRDLDQWLIKSVRTGTVWVVREEGYPEDAVDLPPGADAWPKAMQEIYQFTYTPKQFRAGRPTYLGVYVRRQTRQGGSWSYHSWAQALDAGIARPDGSYNHRLADEMKVKVTAEFRPVLMYIITYREDPALHGNHNHKQIKPPRDGQTPPLHL